ncbi:hypothetical protein D7030_14575 [Flavobacteriaceae bacterium AU392]|nr:hypothetical protein D1817_03915 [Flavobacteriaceae bacterium]RKM81522.1 hypothetical protein D7030_14575 [Flavobacteriaceae bacterium AU392]
MRKHILVLFLLSSTFFITAQSKLGPITIIQGEEIIEDSEKIVRIAGELNDKIYTLAIKKKAYFVKVFNSSDMSLISTNEIDLSEFNGKDIDFEDFAVINNGIYVFGSVYDKKTKISNLFGFEVSEDGKLTNKKKKIFSTKVTKKKERGAFYFKDSPTEDRLLILHATIFEKEEAIQYEIKLLDQDLSESLSHLEKIPFKDRKDLEFTIADFDVSINDDVFLVINESYRDRKEKTNKEKFQIHAFKSENAYNKEIIDIKFTDKEIINCEMLANQDGKLQLVGFYSSVRKNGKTNKDLKGVYASVINVKTNAVEQLRFNELDHETKVKLIGERRAKKGKDVKPLYLTHSLIERNDGGLILLSEYQLIQVGRSSGIGPLAVTPIQHINNEIIVTSLNPDGSIDWTNVIAKKQIAAYASFSLGFSAFSGNGNFTVGAGINVPIATLGRGPEYLSAMPIYENEQLIVIFNDNEKNINITDIEEIKTMKVYNKAIPTAYVFDKEGNINRVDQGKYQKGQLILRPRVFYRKSPNEYIIYSSRKSQDKLGRLFLE